MKLLTPVKMQNDLCVLPCCFHSCLQIGELTRGDCSMVGAWGKATLNGHTLTARALDWDTAQPFTDNAAVIVYHPANSTYGVSWVNIVSRG